MNTMNNGQSGGALIPTAAVLGAVAVGLGAFGAHGLADTLTAAGTLEVWKTAVLYHLVHALGALVLGLSRDPRLENPGWLMLAGVVLFSGSLYILALGGPRWMGPITPFGGILFIAAWLWIFGACIGKRRGAP